MDVINSWLEKLHPRFGPLESQNRIKGKAFVTRVNMYGKNKEKLSEEQKVNHE
jgi:hypothetical protein